MPLCVNSNSIAPKLCNELPVNYSTYWFWAVQNGTETAIVEWIFFLEKRIQIIICFITTV